MLCTKCPSILVKEGKLSSSEQKVIFSNVEQLGTLSAMFLNELTHAQENSIGAAYVKFSPFFKMYSVWCGNYSRALQLISELSRRSAFRKALEKCREDCDGHSLESLLIMPIQRVPRHVLLLQELLECTPTEHPDFAEVSVALETFEEVASHLNEQLKQHEMALKVFEVHRSLRPTQELFSMDRRLVHSGELCKMSRRGKKQANLMFWLFNDCLLYGRPTQKSTLKDDPSCTQSKYKFKQWIRVATVAELESGRDDLKNAFMVMGTKSFILLARSSDERSAWLSALRSNLVPEARCEDISPLEVISKLRLHIAAKFSMTPRPKVSKEEAKTKHSRRRTASCAGAQNLDLKCGPTGDSIAIGTVNSSSGRERSETELPTWTEQAASGGLRRHRRTQSEFATSVGISARPLSCKVMPIMGKLFLRNGSPSASSYDKEQDKCSTRGWTPRLFILRDSRLCYFKGAGEKKPAGEIDLSGGVEIRLLESPSFSVAECCAAKDDSGVSRDGVSLLYKYNDRPKRAKGAKSAQGAGEASKGDNTCLGQSCCPPADCDTALTQRPSFQDKLAFPEGLPLYEIQLWHRERKMRRLAARSREEQIQWARHLVGNVVLPNAEEPPRRHKSGFLWYSKPKISGVEGSKANGRRMEQRVFAVLKDDALYYYARSSSLSEIGKIPLRHASVEAVYRQNLFLAVNLEHKSELVHNFRADDANARDTWCKELQEIIAARADKIISTVEFEKENNLKIANQEKATKQPANQDEVCANALQANATGETRGEEGQPLGGLSIEVEEKRLRGPSLGDDELCAICFSRKRCRVFVPCGHFRCCAECSDSLSCNICPFCRQPILQKVRVFF